MCPEALTGHWIRFFVHRTVVLQVGEWVENVPETQKTPYNWVTIKVGWEDPLEKDMATSPVFLPGESHEQRNLAGYSPQGHKRIDWSDLAYI